MTDEVPEVQCPACGATIRSRLGDQVVIAELRAQGWRPADEREGMESMGWCSATEIMDRAYVAAWKAVQEIGAYELSQKTEAEAEAAARQVLSPFVAALADVLRDGDWDCIEESNYFDQYPQEMLGHSDDEHLTWLVEQVKDAADYQSGDLGKWTDKLAEHKQKMGTN